MLGSFKINTYLCTVKQVGIAVPGEAWGTDVLTLTDGQKAELKALADKLIE